MNKRNSLFCYTSHCSLWFLNGKKCWNENVFVYLIKVIEWTTMNKTDFPNRLSLLCPRYFRARWNVCVFQREVLLFFIALSSFGLYCVFWKHYYKSNAIYFVAFAGWTEDNIWSSAYHLQRYSCKQNGYGNGLQTYACCKYLLQFVRLCPNT